jgi:hypothetical protein
MKSPLSCIYKHVIGHGFGFEHFQQMPPVTSEGIYAHAGGDGFDDASFSSASSLNGNAEIVIDQDADSFSMCYDNRHPHFRAITSS